jgi:ribosomal protein S18 acetylase RimI-like enzyme
MDTRTLTPVTIRPLRFEELRDLAAAIPDELTLAQVENRWREQALGYRELLAAETEDGIAGTVSMRETGLNGDRALHLFALEVAPERRGHGIGSALVEHVLAEAERRGCVRVYLEVRVNNPARRLYHRLGFRRVGTSFVNTWWQFKQDGTRARVDELSYRMVRRVGHRA